MRKTSSATLCAVMLSIASLALCIAETHQSPLQSSGDNDAADEPNAQPLVCPHLPEGMMDIVCQALGSAEPPGDFTYSIRYCCAHSARDFHNACEQAKKSCYTMHIIPPPGTNEPGHAINLIEEPKGTCRFVDITGGSIRIGDTTFPCNKPPEQAICRAINRPEDCGWSVKTISQSPVPGWGPDQCANSKEVHSGSDCAKCCSETALYFKGLAREPSETRGRYVEPLDRFVELRQIATEWQMDCNTACESRWTTPIEKDLGVRFARDICQHPKIRALYTCDECCERGAKSGDYPKKYEQACKSDCAQFVTNPEKPQRKPRLPGLRPKPKKPKPSPNRPRRPIRRK